MVIVYLYQDQYPWDVRAEKFLISLAQAGHEIHIVSRNKSGRSTIETIGEQITVHRLPSGIGGPLRTAINFPAFFSPFWIGKLFITTRKYHCTLILVRDLPLGPTALLVGKILGIPVIMDLAENYPAMIRSTWKYRGVKLKDRLLRNPYLLQKLEEWILPLFYGVIVVSRESGERIKLITNANKVSISVVGNTPRIAAVPLKSHPLCTVMGDYPGLVVLYTGGVEAHRGLDMLIRAVSIVVQSNVSILAVIVGTGTVEERLKSLAKELGVCQHLLFAGWMDPSHIPSVINAADIGIVPHYVTPHTDTTIPNKIFDYMLAKKPVIVTQARTLVNIVQENKCGMVYADNKPEELAQRIIELQDEPLRHSMGIAGYLAVKNKYNWAEDEKELLACISKFS